MDPAKLAIDLVGSSGTIQARQCALSPDCRAPPHLLTALRCLAVTQANFAGLRHRCRNLGVQEPSVVAV